MLSALALLLILFVVTFLLGSVPWGVVISRLVYHKDLREEGSGNIGTTNAMRSLGKAGGAAVFVLDFGKGLVSGLLATVCACFLLGSRGLTGIDAGDPLIVPLLCATGFDKVDALGSAAHVARCASLAVAFAGCTLGHIFSPWLGWHGGKGIAVAVGALFFVFGPVGALLEIALFAVIVLTTRYVSAGSVAAALAVPAACPLLLLGRLAVLGRHHGGGARGGVGAPRQHRPPAPRHRAPHRRQEEGGEGRRERARVAPSHRRKAKRGGRPPGREPLRRPAPFPRDRQARRHAS